MNWEQADITIMEYLQANWTACKVSYAGSDHLDYSSPGQPKLEDGQDPFIIFDLIHERSAPIGIPTGCIRLYGFLSASIYVREGSGRVASVKLADQLNSLLQFNTIPGSSSGEVRIKEFLDDGVFEADGWEIRSCQWPFETEDFV